MNLELLDNQQLKIFAATISDEWSSPGAIFEILRQELSARITSTRRVLCLRAVELMAPITIIELDDAKAFLDTLIHFGDATEGPGGWVAAAPLRAVIVGKDKYSLHGTIPTRMLMQSLPATITGSGVYRICTIVPFADESFRAAVAELGGIVMNPQRWAGLERILPAGPPWLEYLSLRLENMPLPQGAADYGPIGSWAAYMPEKVDEEQNKRWKKDRISSNAQLWRAWNDGGWWVFVWTSGGSPHVQKQMRLTRDEATRTMFSIDVNVSMPLSFSCKKQEEIISLELSAFLPRAEFRFLTTMAQLLAQGATPTRYLIESSAWEETQNTLSNRLGVSFREEIT
jgi:hypothetical protein